MVRLPDTNMRSRVSASCLRREVVGPREFCRLAQVTAGARPRKTVTGKMAKFDRFLLFSASLHCKRKTASGQRPKTAEIDQPSEAKRVRTVDFYIFYTSTRPLQSDSVLKQKQAGAKVQ